MFCLIYKTIISPIMKMKSKILQLLGFGVSKPCTYKKGKTVLHKFICNMYNIAYIKTCIF
jgi:hypothetical protein